MGNIAPWQLRIATAPGDNDVSRNVQALLAAIAGVSPYRILDLGCGPGRDLVTFRDLGHVVVGLDGCPEFVAMARAVSGCEVWQQDMLAMTLPSASFDGVFANAVLFHLPSLALPGVLDRLHAALKPDGALLISNPHGQDEEGFVDGRYACFYSFKTWRRLVSDSGLPWSTATSARRANPAASSRGSPPSGASQPRLRGVWRTEAEASARRSPRRLTESTVAANPWARRCEAELRLHRGPSQAAL